MNSRSRVVLLLCVSLPAAGAHAQLFRDAPRGEAVERQLPGDVTFTPWVHDASQLGGRGGDRLEVQEVPAEQLETVKLANVVPPVHFESGIAEIPESTVASLRGVLAKLHDRRNVRLHLVGHADTQPLSPALAAVFGDNEGLSRERAGEVAEFLKRSLELPPEAIAYEWAGDTKPIASNATADGRARNRRVEVEVWYDEPKAGSALQEVLVKDDFRRVKVCRTETVCRLRYVEGQERRTRVQNLVAPLRFSAEQIDVTPEFVAQVGRALRNMSDRHNVLVKLVGYTDDAPLGERNERIYGTHEGLSRARARRVALAVQEALGLPTAAIDSDGRGTARPLGSNATAQGRALNRRVEVEFWYDDPLQELPDEPQLCPVTGDETVTHIYDPPWGSIPRIELDNGKPIVPAGYADLLRRGLADVAGKTRARLRFIGYTANETLERRTARVYEDDVGLSAARAHRAMDLLGAELGLAPAQLEFEGRGYVQSDDVVNGGFVQGPTSYVVAQVVYEEVAERDDYDGVNVTPLVRELEPQNAFGLNMMRITVDGKPLDDPNRSSEDVQRCTDVALNDASIRFGFDNLEAERRLAVAARPARVVLRASEEGPVADPVRFTMYANYSHFIDRSELRIFDAGQSLEAAPLAVVELGTAGSATWQPPVDSFAGPTRELRYVLRVYGKGAFDETDAQPLWLVRGAAGDVVAAEPAVAAESESLAEGEVALEGDVGSAAEIAPDPQWETTAPPAIDGAIEGAVEGAPGDELGAAAVLDASLDALADSQSAGPSAEALVDHESLRLAYGENALRLRNIPLASGSVTVRGSAIPPDHTVFVAGRPVPVDGSGNFIAQEILPAGIHTVEVAVLDDEGNGEMYLRDIDLERNDWFYVGMADVTLSHNDSHGPIELLQGENPAYDVTSSADAQLAFYLNGKLADGWRLTASADTRDGPIHDLFSNFLSKSPESLFRRIDPDYHYPTFGDDATVEEMAPTLGKLYVKAAHGDDYALWGNFKVGYMDNELAQVDRGLYGMNLHYESERATSFGERRYAVDGFTAEPGTIASFEEFRGTGGSLYYLRRQDLLTGSERVRVEFRDHASGLVIGVKNLTPGIDYDIDYLQGRVLLSEPLASTAEDDLLVRDSALRGDEAYLVVRYEYTPGFDQLDAMSVGAQGHYWFGDRVKVGLTANDNDDGGPGSTLDAADVTVRISSDSWFKLQGARTEGLVTTALRSVDGGFGFAGYDDSLFSTAEAGGYRADVGVGLGDLVDGARGRFTLYGQDLDAGYSMPGLATPLATRNYGGTFRKPLGSKAALRLKSDHRTEEQGLEMSANEIDLEYQLNEHWGVSTGIRDDVRTDFSPVVPLTQEQGKRRDGVVQMEYDSKARWSTYGFVQDTLSETGGREENGRVGTGGSYLISDRLRINAEVSDGDLGRGGRFGTRYMPTDRTTFYVNYALENERTDNGLLPTATGGGSTIAGVKTRLSGSTSVYVEERYRTSLAASGLTHATGVNLAPTESLNLAASTDFGTLRDMRTGAETERRAAGFSLGYGFTALQLSTGIEFRSDDTEQPDLSFTNRETWLFRSSFKYQMSLASRLLGKLNRSESVSSLGAFYDGGYTEAVLGYAFRPVRNDRLNALVKYTYLYNVPTTDQLTLNGRAAEYIQKTHVAALDLTYDITSRWSIGGKYAHRIGEMSLSREDPLFFDNAADLYIVRADFRFMKNWEGMIEGRRLAMADVHDRQDGTLVALSRYLNKHLKVGAGYNFTDYSDDLTDLSYDHRGVFVSMTGVL